MCVLNGLHAEFGHAQDVWFQMILGPHAPFESGAAPRVDIVFCSFGVRGLSHNLEQQAEGQWLFR